MVQKGPRVKMLVLHHLSKFLVMIIRPARFIETLVAKCIVTELNDVLQDQTLLKVGALIILKVKWMSRGRSLRILLLLKVEVTIFLIEQKTDLVALYGYRSRAISHIHKRSLLN